MEQQENQQENKIEHYFDWAATSPADSQILNESLNAALKNWGNPSSSHSIGKEAKAVLEEARKKSAEILGVTAEKIFFTSGGTESDHIPILSILNRPKKGSVLISSIEHPAVREMALELKKCGWTVDFIPADKNGIITPQAVEKKLTQDTALVCVMSVNNETGAIQPIYEIADTITKFSERKRKPKFHVDCVQAAGKIPLNLSYKGIDSVAISAHKICGPRGIGILYIADAFEPFLKGGGQEKGIRSGTENVFGAVAISKALEKYWISDSNQAAKERLENQINYTQNFIKKLAELKSCTIIPETRILNPENYSPWVVQASFENIPGQVMLRALDAEGFYISTGSACSSRKNNRPVLEAMHVTPQVSENAVRFSFGPLSTKEGIEELFEKIKKIVKKFN